MYIKGLTHYAFYPSNMEETLRFYCDCLGLERVFDLKNDDGSDWLIYLKISDRQFIELFYGGAAKDPVNWPKTVEEFRSLSREDRKELDKHMTQHLCFEVSDIEKLYARVKEFGYPVRFNKPPTKGADFNIECFIMDPDDNMIELMQFTDDALQLK